MVFVGTTDQNGEVRFDDLEEREYRVVMVDAPPPTAAVFPRDLTGHQRSLMIAIDKSAPKNMTHLGRIEVQYGRSDPNFVLSLSEESTRKLPGESART